MSLVNQRYSVKPKTLNDHFVVDGKIWMIHFRDRCPTAGDHVMQREEEGRTEEEEGEEEGEDEEEEGEKGRPTEDGDIDMVVSGPLAGGSATLVAICFTINSVLFIRILYRTEDAALY